eukprot:1920916-Rhodomonas_salina.1
MEERISVVEKGMDRITQLLQTLVDERTAAPRLASQPAADSGSQPERGGSGERDGAVSESQSGVELSLRGEPNAHFDYSSDAETPRALLEAQPKNWLERRGRQLAAACKCQPEWVRVQLERGCLSLTESDHQCEPATGSGKARVMAQRKQQPSS